MSNLNVLVAVPSMGVWKEQFGISLCQLVVDFSRKYDGYDTQNLRVFSKKGSLLPQMREELANHAVEGDFTHILFVDSDQKFPPYTLRRLLSWRKPIVACNIVIKKFPTVPTARGFVKGSKIGRIVFTREGMDGLEQVWRIGTGVMLIEVDALRRIERPWFPMKWLKDEKKYVGEDWGFCERAELFGVPIFIDHGLSLDIGHIGDIEFTHDMVVDLSEEDLR